MAAAAVDIADVADTRVAADAVADAGPVTCRTNESVNDEKDLRVGDDDDNGRDGKVQRHRQEEERPRCGRRRRRHRRRRRTRLASPVGRRRRGRRRRRRRGELDDRKKGDGSVKAPSYARRHGAGADCPAGRPDGGERRADDAIGEDRPVRQRTRNDATLDDGDQRQMPDGRHAERVEGGALDGVDERRRQEPVGAGRGAAPGDDAADRGGEGAGADVGDGHGGDDARDEVVAKAPAAHGDDDDRNVDGERRQADDGDDERLDDVLGHLNRSTKTVSLATVEGTSVPAVTD